MTPLLPMPNHLRHPLHRLPPLLQPRPQRPLPKFPLNLLPHARTLQSQSVLDAFLIFDIGMLG